MPDRLYQLWAKDLPQCKNKLVSAPRDKETTHLESLSSSRGCRPRFLPEAQIVPVSIPVKRQRGNHDS